MSENKRITEGDSVKVFPCDNDMIFYYGVVRHVPVATGDAWVIEDSAGVITHQQTYNRIVLTGRGRP